MRWFNGAMDPDTVSLEDAKRSEVPASEDRKMRWRERYYAASTALDGLKADLDREATDRQLIESRLREENETLREWLGNEHADAVTFRTGLEHGEHILDDNDCPVCNLLRTKGAK